MPKFIAIIMAFAAGILGSGADQENLLSQYREKKEEIKEMATEYKSMFRLENRGSGATGVSANSGVSGATGQEGPTGTAGMQYSLGHSGPTGVTGLGSIRDSAVNLRGEHQMPVFIPKVAIEKSEALDFLSETPYPTVPGQVNSGSNGNGNAWGRNK